MNGIRYGSKACFLAVGMTLLSLLSFSPVLAGTLNVDIGGSGQQTLPGYETFTISAYGAVPVTQSYTNDLGAAGQVTVVLDTNSTITGLAGTGDVNHPTSNVVEELAYIDSWLSLTLQDLKAGTYYLRSYHHDPNVVRGNIDIHSSDAVGVNVLRYDDLVQTTGATPGVVATAPMILHANGTDDVVVRATRTGSLRAIANGFQITDTLPEDLKVDIGVAGASNDVQAGFQSFAMTNDGGSSVGDTSAPQAHWYFAEMGNQGSVEVALSSAATTPRVGFRDRVDATGTLGDLVEDAVYNSSSRELTLTLGSLKPGAYTITSWHNDQYVHGALNIRVSDPLGADQDRATGLTQSNTTDSDAVIRPTYSFVSNGIDPVVVTFESPAPSDNFVMLNGFEVTAQDALRVDFGKDPGTDGGRDDVQNGFQQFNAANHNSGFADGVYRDYTNKLGNSDTVRVTVNCDDNSLLVRDRGDVVGPLGDVSEDFIFDDSALELVISDLKAGRYVMSTYHHDSIAAQSTFNLLVTDDAGTLRTVASGMTHTMGTLGAPSSATFEVFANGTDDLLVRFARTSGGGMALSGFSLSMVVPEPGSLVLAGLGAFLLLPWGRRARSRRHGR